MNVVGFFILLIAAFLLNCHGLQNAHNIELLKLPGDQAAVLTVYDDGIMQLKVVPLTGEFYEVNDVVVATPLTTVNVSLELKKGRVASKGSELYFLLNETQLLLEYRIRGVTEIKGTVNLTKNEPSAHFRFLFAKHLYGIPEHATDLGLKNDTNYELFNLDAFHYNIDDPAGIYGSIPFIMAHSADHTIGLLMLNSAVSYVAVSQNNEIHWNSEVGISNFIFIPGSSPREVQKRHAYLTGSVALPPLFALGFHQCRWNYRSSEDSLAVDAGFDNYNLPYDVLWLDIEHTDGKKYFTWDKHNFPHPKEMVNTLALKGRKVVTIVDPHVKRESGYSVFDTASSKRFFVKREDGKDYEGHCWPGTSSWVDFYNKKARDWYSSLFSFSHYVESTPDVYTWVDMNEPSVFSGPKTTMDGDALHENEKHIKVEHKYLHNMYGHYNIMSVYNGQLLRSRELNLGYIHRPFLLTRSFFAGSQRYAAMWTGDNMAKWDHLEKSVPMILSLSIANFPFAGADVGGFFFDTEKELMIRWMQLGVFYPFFRAHAHLDTKRREPWLFGEDVTMLIRDALHLRYSLLPYIYTTFFKANQTGDIIVRPLFYMFPHEESLTNVEHSYMFGEGLLVRPVTDKGAQSVRIELPSTSSWFNYYTGEEIASGSLDVPVTLSSVPLYIRGGSIIPTKQRIRRCSANMVRDPYTLYVAINDKKSVGELYVDDTISLNYLDGKCLQRRFEFTENKLVNTVASIGVICKGFNTTEEVERVIIYGLKEARTLRAQVGDKVLNTEVSNTGAFIINNLKLQIASDWFIELTKS